MKKTTVFSFDVPFKLRLNAHLIRLCHMDRKEPRWRKFFARVSGRLLK